jgi:amino acid adenylation domain-containing protein
LDGNPVQAGVTIKGLSIPRLAAYDEAGPVDRAMSFSQQRLWFLEQLGAVGDAYRIQRWMDLEGELDREAIGRALDRIASRHDPLRATFHSVDARPVQRIAPPSEGSWFVVDHDLRGADDPVAERARVMDEARREGFDLERGPLMRAHLIRTAERRHTLMICAHHIVTDGWSMGIFDHELGQLYGAFTRGEADPLPALATSYADYAEWQRQHVDGEFLKKQADYWKETLTGAPELLELPTDHPRPARQDHTGAFAGVELSTELAAGLRALSQRHGSTLYMTLLAGWATVLSRLSGQNEAVIGTPAANRRKREITRLIGFFVNTLALRVDLSGSPTVAELLGRVKSTALAAQRHQDIPFEQVVETVQPVRSMAHSPLFQVVFTWQNAFRGTLEMPGLSVVDAGWGVPVTAMFDLTLTLQEEGDRIVGGLGYATALFERETVERVLEYLRRVYEEMVADDQQPVDRIALLPAAERRLVVEEWNATDAEYPAGSLVHELFEAQVERAPDAVAVVFEGERLTYGELNARANQLAHHLRERGVGPDVRVGICVERSLEMMVGLLGILKAGGAYLPLDPAYPADRLQHMLEDGAPAVLLTQEPLAGLFAGSGVPVLDLQADAWVWAGHPVANPERDGLATGHLAYVIYTSGSTGLPKGVMNQHGCIVNRLTWGQRAWRMGTDEAILGQTSLNFDGHLRELFWPLTAGGRIVMARPEGHRDPRYLLETIRAQGVTTLNLVPSLLQLLLEHEDMPACAGLRRVLCGGEALPGTLVRRFHDRLPGAVLHNLYGPSEAATAVSTPVAPEYESKAVVPIGRPGSNVRTYILDREGNPTPVGVAGELHVGGAGVARGYLNRPALTAERFVADPFAGEPGARMYRTGDLARWLPDGTIEFLGRNDFQVKIRGFRVELGEIEARIAAHAEVREAVVLAREDAPGDRRLVAYYVAAEPIRAEELRAHAAERLPEYMVPAAYVWLEALPLTPNGKVDRRALPAPDGSALAARAYEAPVGATETELAEIWGEVLKVSPVGRNDHFFELGGHSLLAMTLIERMRQRGLHADIRSLFTTLTLAEFAAAVDSGHVEVAVPANAIPADCEAITPEMLPLVKLAQAEIDRIVEGVPGGAANVQDIYPLAPLQEGILFHHLLATEGDPYLLSVVFSIEHRERLDAFLAAMQAAVARHDILRTAVVWEGLPEPVQVVWRSAPLRVEEVELGAGDPVAQLHERFDPRHHRVPVSEAPLMRAYTAWDAEGERWLLLLLRHHLVSDHTTVEALLREVQAHLQGRGDELPAALPFRDFVAQARLGIERGDHDEFFHEMLDGVTEPTAPFGLLQVQGDGSEAAEARLQVDGALAARMRERARKLGVSVASLCHVAYAQVLARVSGRDDVVFGTLMLGRMHAGAGADRVMGPFINTLPIRLRVGGVAAEACVRRTHTLLAELMRHEHAPLALAQRCSAVQAPTPLFSALLNYRHGAAEQTLRSADARKGWGGIQVIHAEERTNYPLALSVDDLGDGFWITAQVQASVGAERVCAMMHTALEGLLEALQTAPGTSVARIEVLPAAERRRVVEEWNATDAEYPAGTCIHELFQAQAELTPHAVAVTCSGESLTYDELNARANRLAFHLRERGAGPESFVAILVPRSIELVVAELAILKAGAAYVPIDPSFPADRIAFMVEDSGARLVLGRAGDVLPVLPSAERIDVDALPACPAQDVRTAVESTAPAYVMYTSGSTGAPKGVVVPHRAIARLVLNNGYVPFAADDRVAFAANPAFDATTMEVWGPLLTGGRIVVIGRDVLLEPLTFARVLKEEGVTALFITTAVFNQYAESIPGALAGLRYLLTGGETADPASFGYVLGQGGRVQLIHCYGPTEATTFAITHPVTAVEEGALSLPLGRPISNTRVYLLDAAGEPVPVGVPGEMYIGGPGVALGYLNRPDLTAERFVEDRFGGTPGARLYRTGDLGRWLADGTIEFLGRNDFQVKIRGFRIELGEIEARLAVHPDVREVVVLAREDAPGAKRLVAYYVGAEVEVEALREHLAERLPVYMIPAAYVRLPELPLTPNGKVDRKALPAPEADAFAARAYEAPAGELETALAEIWSEVLGVERVGRHDHFFELGGHSLLAVQIVSRVRQTLGLDVALGDLFLRPALADFAHALEAASRAQLPAIKPAGREGPLALSFAQQRLWFIEQLGGSGRSYNISAQLRLRGELHRGALGRALDRIVERHEALRTTFHSVDGEPVQVVAETGGFPLADHDLTGHADPEAELRRLTEEEAAAPFDLARGPLVRGRLVRLAADDHVLLGTMHHIVSDGWSTGVLTQELGALYGAYLRGAGDPLPPLAIQYADYAAWQRRWVEGEVLQRQADYWTERLAGAPELLELPADHARPAVQDHAGAYAAVELDEELTAALKALSRRQGTTLFMTLLAGWATVLGRLSGQDDLVVGTPMANRGRREIEGLIGFFVNTVALRLDLSGTPTVAELLGRVKESALGAQQHPDLPFEQVVERVQPTRSLSHSPLFQVMFTWQNTPQGGLELPGLTVSAAGAAEQATAKFDMTLNLQETDGRIAGGVVYATSLFERATVERHIGYLRRVLEAMAADELRGTAHLPLLSDAERWQVVEGWNATDAEYPADACLHQLLERQVRLTPDAVAVSYQDEHLTYAQLNARANRLAHYLRERGVGPDARVGFCVDRSLEMMVGLFAVMKAGGAYVPLDPGYPADRLRYMLHNSEPVALLTQRSLAGVVEGLIDGLDVPVIDLDAPVWEQHCPDTNPEPAGLTPDHLAYVIYTSGSTGLPKGVMVAHRSVVNVVTWMQETFGLQAHDSVLQKTPISFDASARELYSPMMAGARLVMAKPEGHKDPAYMVKTIRREGITSMHFVPSMLQIFLEHPEVGGCTTLRQVVCGGEALPTALVRELNRTLPGVAAWNVYGPTEAAVDVTAYSCERLGDGVRVPIGRPMANVRLYVLDAQGEPVPVGVAGELHIGGVQVARGYLNRADLTEDRFVADPFADEPGARLYRTGDLCRWLPDGAIEYLGRNDGQVKVRGFRIELGEIEARLREHPAVREAAVVAREDAGGDKRLVAYCVGAEVEVEAMRAWLGGQLPEHMVPAAYVWMERFPLTPNGKLDRRALPAPDADAYSVRAYEAPVGPAEVALAAIWAELLGVERVGRNDHFFELGGHSLRAVQVVSRVRQAMGIEIALGDLFARPVLADFARPLAEAARAHLPAIEPVERTGPLPLSFAQQRLWFLEQMGGVGRAYHIPARLRLRGQLDGIALRAAMDRIVERHEALRTVFAEVNGQPVQVVIPAEESGFALGEHDLSGRRDAEAELERITAEEARAPFDLARGPLVRGRLVRMGEDEHVLLVTMHHIVSDGWSTGLLIHEVGALYGAFRRGQGDPLAPLPVQYADYAAWQRKWVGPEQAEYWAGALAGAPELLELPTDRPRPAVQDTAGAVAPLVLDEELTAALKALGQKHGTTLFMTLMAGWAAVLARLSGQDDLVIGTPTANRGRTEIEGLIGFFVNTLALRVDLSGEPTVAELLERVKARSLQAQAHQDIPFEQVVEVVKPTRSTAHTPLFQVMFVWQNAPRERLALDGLQGSLDTAEHSTSKFDLTLTLQESEGRIVGGLEYATALFEAETMERWLGYLRRALREMAAGADRRVDRLPLLSAAERVRVVEEWNATDADFPREACIHELFEARALSAPHAVAVECEDEQLTYAQLNARANRLAHYLRGRGVGPDARVGICVERSAQMVVGLLATLKAGGAYLPLDPGYPADRLRYMVEDARPALLLTQAPLAGLFAGTGVPVVDVACADAWAGQPSANPARGELTSSHLAYVIYTSGSTGLPKGVMIEHRSLVNHTLWQAAAFGINEDDSVLQRTSISFDASVWELWTTLSVGARMVLLPPDAARDPGAMGRVIARSGVTVAQFVPTLLQAVLRAMPRGAKLPCRYAFCGGEPLTAALVAEARRAGVREVVNLYGPTEATIESTSHVCVDDGLAPSIGRPVTNARVYVLDAAGEPVPAGVAGEMYIGGAGVARGYLDRPELTAERFVRDPFHGGRMYRTGDLARWRADGTLEFLGRNDHQVKVRGYRIELGEIESRLAAHASVREAVVSARGPAGDKRLVAYYTGGEAGVESLRGWLLETLPEYMVPAAYVRMDVLPLTPSGKVDRKALPAPEGDAFATRGYEAPVGETEEALAAVWAELLGAERVGRHDHFFELGGHSLLAVQVISRVRQVLGAETSLGDLFARPVLADFARGLETAARAGVPAIVPAERTGPLPLSFAQQRLWFLEQLGGSGAAYRVAGGLRLRGRLDRAALGRALDRIVERHESLRTVFAEVDGEPVQVIAPVAGCSFRLRDLGTHAEAELERLASEETNAPFDLEYGPLIRGSLVRLGDDDHVLLLAMHHIVSDGWSIGVLTRELSALYAAFARGEGDPLAPLPVQYADYAAWQRARVDGEVLRAQADFWKDALAGAPELLELPADRPRPAVRDHAGATLGLELDEELTAALKALGQRQGTTLYMTVLAGWATVLARLSGQHDVVIGSPTANRGQAEIEGLIGFFVNTLALRLDLSGTPTVAELLARVKERALEAQAHQDIPFEQVVERVQPARSLSHTPLFQVMFAWQNASQGLVALPGLEVESLGNAGRGTAKFDLTLSMAESEGRIVGGVEFATALFDAATVERYLGYLRRVLAAMAADEHQAVDRLPLLPESERRQVVEEWNATDAEYPADIPVHALFEARAERTPDAVAVVHGDESVTYAQLNARANRLAHHLRERGVGAGEYVAILMQRSIELVVAELGVLKAGAAYVPIDPTFPAERVAFMAADCGARFALGRTGEELPELAGAERIDVDALGEGATENLDVALTSEAAAYVIYTSGSTGTPKGVVVPHRAIARLTINSGYADFRADDRVAFAANPAFDASTMEVWAPLLNGGRIVVIPQDVLLEPRRFGDALRRYGVDVLWMTVGLFNQYADELRDELPLLRYLIVGGDALDPRVIADVLRSNPPRNLLNGYGPTETTTFAITHHITHVAEGARGIPLGRPISNTRIYILDAQGQPVPAGVAGEIHIGGAGVALGYLNQPELTAERFVANPFAGGRMYRTGDLGRWLPDGTIEFLGRNDFQVKIRGFRIELGEIEAKLAAFPGLRDVVVLAREDAPGDKRLVAYCVGMDRMDAEVLRGYLAERLPAYMVPSAFVQLDRLPLTANGKVNRKALPAPEGDAFATRAYEAPVGRTEQVLAEIWAELLDVERVGRNDHFFELGGHSLRAVQVISRVRQALGVEIALGDLFARPVLADFARGLMAGARAELPAIVPADRGRPLPLSFAQQRLWFLEQMGDFGAAYHVPASLRLRGKLDRGALARALERIVERHEALRTTFHAADGDPEQRVLAESRFRMAEQDLSARAEPWTELRKVVAEESAAPFDLENGPLVRARLVKLAADDHVLLVTMHHIVSDGWSMGVLTRELSTLYTAFLRGHGDPLPPLPVQYADYAAWQRGWVDGEVLREQADYWKTTLTGAPELLELPADHPRPARPDHAGALVGLELDEELTAGLKALSQRQGTTLYMTVLAGWATVLARLSGQDDVVIGSPTANRGRAEVEGLIGFFVNTLALRLDLSGAPTVAELMGRVKERAVAAQGNQDIPFEQVVERVQPARSLSHSPLFQVLFAWQSAAQGALELPGLTVETAGLTERETAKFDLSLSMMETGGRIVGGLVYATALFERATAERWIGYLTRVLREMVADETRTTDRIPLLPAAERHTVVEEWNATDAPFPSDACVHELFEAQVERTPHAVAVACGGETMTYAELNARANRLAHHLRALGVKPDVRVGICVERGMEMMVGLYAVLKAGGAYVPLDPSYPADRLRYMLEDGAPALLLTQAPLAGMFEGTGVPVIDLARESEWAHRPEGNPERGELTSGHMAYVIYTSGSTGRPKGVVNQHSCLVNRLVWGRAAWEMGADEAVLCKTSLSFDGSVREVFLPLTLGARVVMAHPEGHKDPDYLVETIRRERIGTVNLVPSMLHVLLEHPNVGDTPALRRVLCGGEAMPGALVRRFRERLPHVELHNLYGPSEAATAVSALVRTEEEARATVPIGRPIANTKVYILDAHGQPVPMGVAGELFIGGSGVALGYLDRPEMTAERFVEDPFHGGRMYRTGDLGRWLPDGSIEFLGRNDFQVKVRGFRIELGEIEARLASHPGVREAVVIVREDVPGDQRLVAYHVGGEVEVEALRAHMVEGLPEYMVPAAYVRMERFPLTPNGKLDRKALPAPEGDAYVTRAHEPPVGATEEALAAVWAELLGVERVGRNDHFFELGGHSLLAVQVVSRVRQALGVEVALRDLFVRPVLAEFARGLETATRAELPPIVAAERGERLPLSFAQQRLWFLHQMGGAAGAYHIPKVLRLRGTLDRAALGRALDRIVERHEALRTTFHGVDGEPEQRIAPAGTLTLIEHDLGGHDDAEAELERLVAEETGAPFDLERGPLVRGRLIRMADDDHVLAFTLHHIVSDGWSTGVIVGELSTLYGAFLRGEADPLPPLPVQYADYAAWQRRAEGAEMLEKQVEYWKESLAGAPELLELPADHPRPARLDHTGALVRMELDEELTSSLKALSQRRGTTLFVTLMAGWSTVLGRLAGQRDVVIGTPTANRGRKEVEGLVGFFINTLALRVDLSGTPTVAELMERVKERALGAQENTDLPFEQVVERVQPTRSLSHAPLFQAMLVWQNTPRETLELPGLTMSAVDAAPFVAAKFDLTLSMAEADGRIVGGLVYATSLFERATVERYLGYLRAVLAAMAADEHQPVEGLALLPPAERRMLVEEWNATDARFPADVCIHELFEAQAERAPHAVAVTYGDRSLTYGELNARSNQLAHYLRGQGVGPDRRVAVCVERGLEMVVGLMATLKAGGAYVPLDPSYPADRLRYMLRDSAPVAVLTQAHLGKMFSGCGVPVIAGDAAQWAEMPESNPERGGLTPEHAAYVIYTSGSTGTPKGVMNPHRGVVNMLAWAQETWSLGADESVLQRMSFSFDVSVRELFWPLAVGARMVVARSERNNDPDYLAEAIRTENVGTLHLVPSLLQLLLEHPEMEGNGLRRVMCGGEALSPALVKRFQERLPHATLYQMYGPTETTVAVTAHACTGEERRERVPLGRPMANTRIYVLDARGEPVPAGVAGELYVGGAQVARGYLDRLALTAERFVPDPFSAQPGARMYRTGDLGRWLADGRLEFVGRNDDQVKVRGFRIELGEIENVLAAYPGVREAVMMVREDAPGDRRLVAYHVGAEDLGAEALRAHLAERLPEHMVPAAYVKLPEFPLTPNGKVDRKALPAPDGAAFATRGYEAPEGETEEALASIWQELLGVERVGRNDHFFELGGHSLLATRLVLRVREEMEVEVALREVFEMPVLSQLAEHILLAQLAQFDPEELARLSELM